MALFDFLRDNWSVTLAPLLGLVAIYALLPRPNRGSVLRGAAAGVAALLVGGFAVARAGAVVGIEMTIEVFLFYVFAAGAILAGGLLVTERNPARAALSFALVIMATCGLFLLQGGPFLMVSTIIVYAGAIIVTFLFVIMLAQQEGLSDADARSREPFLASMTGFLLLCALLYILKITYKPDLDRWVARSGAKLEEIKVLQEKGDVTLEEKKTLIRDLRQFVMAYDRWLRNEWQPPAEDAEQSTTRQPKYPPPGGRPLHDALTNLNKPEVLPDPKVDKFDNNVAKLNLADLQGAFEKLHEIGEKTRNYPLLGSLKPNTQKLSEFSGPRPGRPVVPGEEIEKDASAAERQQSNSIRRDEFGRPYLPAENTAYLGRSLFTDYLLSVELAGTLLLVATVGAIAIATRKSKARSASVNGSVPRRTA